MKPSRSPSLLKDTLSKFLRKSSGKTSRNGRQEPLTSSKVVPVASSNDSRLNHEDVYDPVAEWKTGPLQHHPSVSDAEVASHLDALGWEQTSPGGNRAAQYWQFTPQHDNVDICSIDSFDNKEPDPAAQLHTPVRGSESQSRNAVQHTPLTPDSPHKMLQPAFSDSRHNSHTVYKRGKLSLADDAHGDNTSPRQQYINKQQQQWEEVHQHQHQQQQQQLQQQPQQQQLQEQQLHHPYQHQQHHQPDQAQQVWQQKELHRQPVEQQQQQQQAMTAGPQLLSRPPSMAWGCPTETSQVHQESAVPTSSQINLVSTPGKITLQHQLPAESAQGRAEPARLTTMQSLGQFDEVVPGAHAQPMQDRHSQSPEQAGARQGVDSHQKPPLPSPTRPPAPPSPYNRSHPGIQHSNSFKARHYAHPAPQAGPQRTSSACLAYDSSQLQRMGSGIQLSQPDTGYGLGSSHARMDRSSSGWTRQDSMTVTEHVIPPTPHTGIAGNNMYSGPSHRDMHDCSQPQYSQPSMSAARSSKSGLTERQQSGFKLSSARRSRSGMRAAPGSVADFGAGSAAGSAASAWVQSHSAHQLAANVKALAAEVVKANSQEATVLAVMKLYAVLSQAHFVKRQAADWEGAFLGILALPLPLLLTSLAQVLAANNPPHSKVVRGMAAASLKSVAVWVEGQMQGLVAGPCQGLVQQALQRLVQEANPHMAYLSQQGPSLDEEHPWNDSLLPTRQSVYDTRDSETQLLDTGTLDGLLDDHLGPTMQTGSHNLFKRGVLDTSGLLGSHVLESNAWQMSRQPSRTARHSQAPGMLDTGATCMVMNTQDASDYSQRHPKGLRATYWLFKTDQEDAWYAAASLVGSIATLGEQYIDAMGATKLVKPLFISLRAKDVACRAAALRALHKLCIDSACRAVIARQDSYLQALVRAVHHTDASLQQPAVQILACLIAQDPSTHYVCAEAGLVSALGKLLKRGESPHGLLLAVSEALKHLTASSQSNRNALVASGILPYVIRGLSSVDEGVQYNTARTLRHLALGTQASHKAAAMPAIVPLTRGLQLGRPRVQFACASALAMLVEGHPEACPLIQSHGGITALASMLHQAGAQAKKAAAEALQALAAEDVGMKPEIAKSRALAPLVQMAKAGNLQQQAAAAGALQALAYCPDRLDISAGIAAEGGIQPLVHMVTEGPMPLRSAAAGALCNLALASPHNQAAIVEAGAIPGLIEVVEQAQPDGQYAAAAALYNLAGRDREVRLAIMRSNAVPALVQMLHADSWYCRIVAAEVFGRLTAEWGNREAIEGAGAVTPLLYLLHLEHSPGMLDGMEGPVYHVAYERGQDVIIMKGYKFAKAKTAAAAMLGCLALASPATAAQLFQAGVAEELLGMLESSSAQARAVACACLGDIAQAHPPLQMHLSQGSRLARLVRTMMQFKPGQGKGDSQPDVAAAAATLGVLVANQPLAQGALLQLEALPALLALLQEGSMAQQSVAANVLFDMTEGSGEARRQVDEAGMLARVHHLVASTNPPAVAAGGATAALLQATALLPYAGFAVTAKPSVNLLLLLQIPFEDLGPATTTSRRTASGPLPTARMLSSQAGASGSSVPDAPPRTSSAAAIDGGPAHSMPQIQNAAGSAPTFSSWSGSLPAAVLDVQEAEQNQTDFNGHMTGREQWAAPGVTQQQGSAAQQQILDTYLG